MNNLLRLYQYLAPVVLFPLGSYLWWTVSGKIELAFFAMLFPVIVAYVIPGIGTNVLRLWEINTRFRLGRFRPHHGFVFGSATAILAYPCAEIILHGNGISGAMVSGFVLGSVIGFWNWWYDILAIRADIIRVYNKPNYFKQGAEAIATDYAPVYFGAVGFVYGVALNVIHGSLEVHGMGMLFFGQIVFFQALGLTLPVLCFMKYSSKKHGYSGLNPYDPFKDSDESNIEIKKEHIG